MSTSVNIFRNTIFSSSSGGGKEEQTKSVTITENGTTTITPDEGKTLSRVEVTTEVSPIGRGVYYHYPDAPWQKDNGSLLDEEYLFRFENIEDIYICITSDGDTPSDDGNNFLVYFGFLMNQEMNLIFHYGKEGIIYPARIEVYTPEPPR